MDGEDDHGWDGPNIRPPQASFGDDKYQRQRNPNVRKDRQVFVSKRDEPSKGHDYKRRPHDDRRHGGEDLRNRLNRGTGGGTKASHRHTGERDRNIRDGGKRESHAQRRQHQASSHSKPQQQRSRDRQDNKRSGRDAILQRIMNASRSSEAAAEVRRKRNLLVKETQEAERNIFRKRDRSRDRQNDTKRSKGEEAKDKSEEESEAESGEEEESDETESGEESTDSDGTDQESVASTPDRDGSDGGDREGEEEGDDDEDREEENDNQGSIELSPARSSKKYDSDRSPSKSPTPRRVSGDEETEEPADIDVAPQVLDKSNEFEDEKEQPDPPEHDFRDDLPPYLPSIYGCRSVEEFHCLNKIEEGTYGVVFRARDKKTNEIVALKRLKMEREKEGFPITSLREINTLLISQHQNVVHVREIVVGSNMNRIFIVMDFVEHDMKALMETMRQKKQHFLPGEVKCLMQQLLSAIAHLHDNWILHRDLKTSNLLLSHNGVLKVGDFGLAREYGSPLKDYTAVVVTLWYRAPELLLGKKDYSTPIDVWSIGCIFAEFLLMEPLLPGKSEIEQLNKIFSLLGKTLTFSKIGFSFTHQILFLLGTPNDKIWPEFKSLPLAKNLGKFVEKPHSQLRNKFQKVELSEKGLDMLKSLLIYDPTSRTSCDKAFNHPYFAETPLAIHHSMFPTWPAKSELGASAVKKAPSPKPPSGGGAFKKLEDDEDERGFSLRGAQAPAVWSLKF